MKIEIRYFSKSGNTEKIAYAIGDAVKAEPKRVSEPLEGHTDLLFVGSPLNGWQMDVGVKLFLEELSDVDTVATFTTSATGGNINEAARAILEPKGIEVLSDYFSCKGKFLFTNRKRPNVQDTEDAIAFAKKVLSAYTSKIESADS